MAEFLYNISKKPSKICYSGINEPVAPDVHLLQSDGWVYMTWIYIKSYYYHCAFTARCLLRLLFLVKQRNEATMNKRDLWNRQRGPFADRHKVLWTKETTRHTEGTYIHPLVTSSTKGRQQRTTNVSRSHPLCVFNFCHRLRRINTFWIGITKD